MRIVIDANIFFYQENDSVFAIKLNKLASILNVLNAKTLIYQMSSKQIKNDFNELRKKIASLKINTYQLVESFPNPDNNRFFLNLVGYPSNHDDYIDNALLYSVYKNAIDVVITENVRIKQKSELLGINERVLYINEALEIFGKNIFNKKVSSPPALKDQFVHNLNVNDPFFDSLKEDYEEFEEWFNKISLEGRRCWVYFNEIGSIGALLIYKFENEPIDTNPPLPAKKRLKISTFKVTHTGYKIGELFLKLSLEFSIKNNLAEIYLTSFTRPNDYLVNLIMEYGFCPMARNQRGEDIYIKELAVNKEKIRYFSPTEIAKKFYPIFYDGAEVKKFLIPIRPEYHQRLFPEYKVRQTILPEHLGEFIVEGNTIKKAHFINFKNQKISPGDILLFYRTVDRKEVTSLGITEKVFLNVKDQDDIMKNVGKRGVYEITKTIKKPKMVILFTWHLHLEKPLKLIDLKEMHIFPQSISLIPHEKYLMIKRKGGIDERFTVH